MFLHSVPMQIRLPGAFHPAMVRGMDNSIIFQNDQNKRRFPGTLGKSIVEEKEEEKIVGNEDKQDNALKASTCSLHEQR